MSNHEQSNSENREHVKNFRNVNCVLANHNKVKITREQTSKPQTIMLRFSYLAPYCKACFSRVETGKLVKLETGLFLTRLTNADP